MKTTVEELAKSEFKLLNAYGPEEVKPFIQSFLKKWTKSTKFYVATSILTLLIILGAIILNKQSGFAFLYLLLGCIFAICLIPFHELLHLLAYRILGAKKTSFKSNFRKFYFIAIADKFVANRKEFQVVVLAPFVFITIVLLFLLVILHSLWLFSILGTLFIHTIICSGDFALLSFLEYNSTNEIVTFTDEEKETIYFYEKAKIDR
ncbi:MAG: DUF3267 domain-containing protein [Flavobacterium sp.]